MEEAEKAQTALEQKAALTETKLAQVAAAARLAFNEAQLDAGSLIKDEGLVASLFDFRKESRKKKKPEDK